MVDVVIRYATQEDAALLADLGARAFAQAFGSQNTPENMQNYLAESFSEQKQAEELSQPGSLFLIAEVEGEAVGYSRLLAGSSETCITGANPVELVRIYALQKWVGQGIGSQLMKASIAEAQARGHDVIWLGVWQENDHAIAFYRKWGFREVGTHTFKLGEDLQTDWVMQRELVTNDVSRAQDDLPEQQQ